MQYASVDEKLIALDLTNFGAPYQQLFDQTDVSGADLFATYSHNRFDNPLQKSDEQRYIARKKAWYGEILRDVVKPRQKELGEASPGDGFMPVIYVAASRTPREVIFGQEWVPRNGFYVPVKDEKSPNGYRFFKPGRLIPERIISFNERSEAEKVFAEFDLPIQQLSGFYRPNEYDVDRFVGRLFGPSLDADGRFLVIADRRPSSSGVGRVGSRPAYGRPEIVMELRTIPQEAKVE